MKIIFKTLIVLAGALAVIVGGRIISAQTTEFGGSARPVTQPSVKRPVTPAFQGVTTPTQKPVISGKTSASLPDKVKVWDRIKTWQKYLLDKKLRDSYRLIREVVRDEKILFKPQAGDVIQGGAGEDIIAGEPPKEKDSKIKRVNLCNIINVLINGIKAIAPSNASIDDQIANDVRAALVSALEKLSNDLDCEFTLQDFQLTGGKNIEPLPPEWEDSDSWYNFLLEAATKGFMIYGSRGWTNAYIITFYLGDPTEPATVEGVTNSARKATKSKLDSGLKLVAAMVTDAITSSDFANKFDKILKDTEKALKPQ